MQPGGTLLWGRSWLLPPCVGVFLFIVAEVAEVVAGVAGEGG